MNDPDHWRRYRVAWAAWTDPDTPDECKIDLEAEMDSAQNCFEWNEFQEFKKTLPEFIAEWKGMKEDAVKKIKNKFGDEVTKTLGVKTEAGIVEPITSNDIPVCLDCGERLTGKNKSKWEHFVPGSQGAKTQPVCKKCSYFWGTKEGAPCCECGEPITFDNYSQVLKKIMIDKKSFRLEPYCKKCNSKDND